MRVKVFASVLFFAWSAAVVAAELPAGVTVLDDDIVWDVANPNAFALSRDGKQIAYISKGALWVCRVDAGPPKKLVDLPNTITAILADPANQEQRDDSAASPHNTRYTAFTGPVHLDQHYVLSLGWTRDGNGLVYILRKRVREGSPVAVNHVMYASMAGEVEEVAVIEGQFGIPWEYTTSFHLTADRKFVVISAYSPLIWDVPAARPRVTPYDLLVPSANSGRYLGVEIDTRQLVLVDEQFDIAKRFEVFFPLEHPVDLTWSEDERFVVCRTGDRYGAYKATAIRVDLETGQEKSLGKCNTRDRFIFTGNGSELLHLRVAAANVWGYTHGELGTRATVIDSEGERHNTLTTKQIRRPEKGQRGTTFPPMVAAPDGSYVAMAVPRAEEQAPGAHYHLVDREGRARPFVPVSDDRYITPYYPIAFAEGGRRLIARSGSTLFSLPTADVAEAMEANDEE